MPVEKLLEMYEAERLIILKAQKRQDEIIQQIKDVNDEAFDWISVREAAILTRLSIPTIYRFIDNGKIKRVKHIGSKKYVSRNELCAIDDGYSGNC